MVTADKSWPSSTANQDNPLMDLPEIAQRGTPILALDVWGARLSEIPEQARRPCHPMVESGELE